MMQMSGGSRKYAHELSLEEFQRQSDRYTALDDDGLNQVYKFLLYNNISTGVFLTHPFTVERIRYLQDWSNSREYHDIRSGSYVRVGAEGSVDVSPAQSEAEALRRQIETLQQEIDRIRRDE
jgi:hypothetical protein